MNPSPVDVCALAARVAKLESANRRRKSANAIVLFFVASLLLVGTRHAERVAAAAKADRIEPDVLRARSVEAQEFLLKDENGHVYARFSLTPSVPLMDQNGRLLPLESPRLDNVPVIPGQASLQFYDERGKLVWSAPSKPQFMTVKWARVSYSAEESENTSKHGRLSRAEPVVAGQLPSALGAMVTSLSRVLCGLATAREGNNTRVAHTNPDTRNHVSEEEMKLSAALAAHILYELAVRDDKVPRKPVPAH